MNMLDFSKRKGRRSIRPAEEELLNLYVNHSAKEIDEMYSKEYRIALYKSISQAMEKKTK